MSCNRFCHVTLHCVTLCYIVLHCVTLHYVRIVLSYIILCDTLYYIVILQFIVTLHYMVSHHVTLCSFYCVVTVLIKSHSPGVLLDHHLLADLVDPTQEIQHPIVKLSWLAPPTTDFISTHTLTREAYTHHYRGTPLHSPFLPSSLLFLVHLGHHRSPVVRHFQ